MTRFRSICRLLVLAALALPTARAAAATPQTSFLAPQERMCDPAFEDCRADVLAYIQQETVEIDMGFWMMTDARYANALVAAWQRGVKIRLLMDPNCADQHRACVAQNDQLQAAGIPMRRRSANGILHWKMVIFVGQGQIEFAGANYAPFELTPDQPFVNYTDEIVLFTNTPSLVHSFMTKFDDLWTSTSEFANYANVTGALTRSFPIYPIDPELNFPPDESYRDRAVAAYEAETRKIDVQMFRITDGAHPAAMLRAVRRGVPVRLITDETEYRNPLRLMDAAYVDQMYVNGVTVRFDGHQGIDHEKAIALYDSGLSIIGSSNWTDASSDSQREHNYFTRKSWVFDWLTAQFERKWTNSTGYSETKPFVPLPPDTPRYDSPAEAAAGVATSGVTLSWNGGLWAHTYDVYFGTSPNPPLLAANRNFGPSQSTGDNKVFGLPTLQPGTTYYWKVVSKTLADVPAAGIIRSFTTGGVTPAPNAAPSVSLTSPPGGTTVPARSSVTLTASAADSDGAITTVDFFAGSTLIGTATSAPYTATWTNVPAGTYTLTAVATDDRFASTTSSALAIAVVSAPGTVTLVRGPYLQQPTDHSMVVVWATRQPGPAEVRYGVPGGSTLAVAATSRLVAAIDTGLPYDYYQHAATLGGLSAATSYAYQPFLDSSPAAPAASFKTAPPKGSGAMSFIAFGDSGTGSPEQRQLAEVIARDTFDLAVHVGDIAYGSGDGEGDASFTTYQSYLFDIYNWLPSRPFVPVEGNHDSRPSNGNGKAYVSLFELPRNGATAAFPDHAERYYSFDYGPVHFIALDTEFTFLDPVRQAEQLRWAAADLAATSQPWTIAFFHRAPYSTGGEHGSSPDVRQAFGPLFERYGVDLVLAGHEHDYERTIPIRESAATTDQFVPYVVTGGGGAPLYPAGTSSWTAFSASRHEYVKVAVDACALTLNAIGVDGAVFDTTTVTHCVPGNSSPVVALTSPAAGSSFTAPATVTLTASAGDSDGTIARVDFYAGATLLGTATTAPYTVSWTNVLAGTYTLTAVATDNGAATASASPITITVSAATPPPADLPAGWSHADVGNTGAAGSASFASGTFTVAGAGADVWGAADAFHYAYQTLDGDGTIVARVASIQNVNAWTKAGVMIRNSLSPSAAQGFMLVAASPVKGVPFQRRRVDGGASVSTSGSQSTAPRWVKLVRAGNLLTGYESADGVTWTVVASDTFVLGPTVLVGLGVSSHVTGVTATATFDHVTVTPAGPPPPNTAPAVTLTSPANGATATAPATITLTASASDSDGTIARVDFYAGATLLGTATSAPFTLTWSAVPAGSYTLTAVATDDDGAATTSNGAAVTVTAPPPNVAPSIALTSPAAGSTFTAPATVTLTANASDSDGTIARVDFYAGTTLLGTDSSAPYSVTWTSVPAGSYTLTAVATDNGAATASASPITITVSAATPPPADLPAGWSHADVGNTGVAGSATATGGTFTIAGAGADVWGTADAFHYAYQTLDGDGTIVARVASIQNVNAWTKAGVMIRNSLSPSAAQGFMLVAASPVKGVPFQRRPVDGGASVSTSGSQSTAPRWVKLVRAGNLVTGYESADGVTWTVVASDTFVLGPTVLVGLGVSSHVTGVTATATFDHVTVTPAGPPPPNTAPAVTLTSPLNGATATAPATITLTASASDGDGTIARVDFYAGATLLGTATSAPFTLTWSAVPAGSYTLTAVATDDDAATTTSNAAAITVAARPPNAAPSIALTSPAAGSTFTAPATVTLTANASDSDGTIARVDFYAGATLLGTATTAPYTVTWSAVPAGSYTLTAVATDNGAATAGASPIAITVSAATPPPPDLPAGWSHADVGNTGAAGSASFAAGTFTIAGAGADVWGKADAFHYAYQTLDGDGTIVARVASIQNVNAWTKAGVMIRSSLSPSAAQGFMLVAASPVKGVPFQRRPVDGGASVSTSGSQSTAPRWVKLVRAGNLLTGYESGDGVTWTVVASDTFTLGPTVLIGLGVSSHVTGVTATATFDQVTVTPAGPPPPNTSAAITLTSPNGTTATAPR